MKAPLFLILLNVFVPVVGIPLTLVLLVLSIRRAYRASIYSQSTFAQRAEFNAFMYERT